METPDESRTERNKEPTTSCPERKISGMSLHNYCREPSLWVRPQKVWWISPGEFVLTLIVADFREFNATLKGLTDPEIDEAFKVTLKASIDGGGFGRGLRHTFDGVRELMLNYQHGSILCFLAGGCKDAHRAGGRLSQYCRMTTCDGALLAQEKLRIYESYLKACCLAAGRPIKMGVLILPSVFSRKHSTSPAASMVSTGQREKK